MAEPAQVAEAIINELGIRSVEDLYLLEQIVFERKAIIQRKPLKSAEARIIIGSPYSVITISESGDPRRERFSIVHELGHLELHRYQRVSPCSTESVSRWSGRQSSGDLETEANEFAAAFLMPTHLFAPLCQDKEPSMNIVAQLASKFSVSLMATSRRYVVFSEYPAAVVWTEGRYIKWFKRNDDFADYGFFPDIGSVVNDRTVASGFFNGENLPTSPRSVKASAWMRSGRFRDISILEHCITMPSYNGVLSLLWVDDTDDDNDEEEDW